MIEESAASASLSRARLLARERRLSEARVAYEHVLASEPENAEALRALIALASHAGEPFRALEYAHRHLAFAPGDAVVQMAVGRLNRQLGQLVDAQAAYQDAIRLDPASPEAWIGMGMTLREMRRFEDARRCYGEALRLDPDHAGCLVNLANVLADLGRASEAEAALSSAIAVRPDWSEPRDRLGRLLAAHGRFDEAVASFHHAVALAPQSGELRLALGMALTQVGGLDQAAAHFREACRLLPDAAEPYLRLAEALRRAEQYDEAIPAYERALKLDPLARIAYVNLGGILKLRGDIQAALDLGRKAVAVDPNYAMGHVAIAEALLSSGDAPGAMQSLRQALERDPGSLLPISNCLLASNYLAEPGPVELLELHRELAGRLAIPQYDVPPVPRPHVGADARMRIGFVSADFRDHSVSFFIEPFLAAYDRTRFAVTCYYNGVAIERTTERLQGLVDGFRLCAAMDDEALAQCIRGDGIDILVDLSGHTAGHRLAVFARRPAPVQATYLGYPTTTGLQAIDFRITDRFIDPPGSEALNVERPIRLVGGAFCYRPPDEAPPVNDQPQDAFAPITYGCFNNLAKFSEPTIRAWGRILARQPGARLLLKAKGLADEGVRDAMLAKFAAAGIERDRLLLQPWLPGTKSHLACYHMIDVALDTFPYNGATTTCEALWMGVPVITWSGNTHASRMGCSILHAAALEGWIADSEEDYVAKAADAARDRRWLAATRQGLRTQLRASALLDQKAFARAFEQSCVAMRAAGRVPSPGDGHD